MSRWNDVSDLIKALNVAYTQGTHLTLDVSGVQKIWPNTGVPISALVAHYKGLGLTISIEGDKYPIQASSWRNPIEATSMNLSSRRMLNTVWAYFNEEEAIALTNSLLKTLEKNAEFEDGVHEALNFCLYEVLDNVFQHSQSEAGYLMAVLSEQGAKLSLAIADTGVGVLQSFRGSQYNPPSHADALTLAVQAGVTRTGDKRGNGLFALRGTVEENEGALTLRSGPGVLDIKETSVKAKDFLSTPRIAGSCDGLFVDWQLYLRQPVSLASVLGMPIANLHLEALENESGEHVVKISEHDAGTGSRKAAEQLRLYMVNQLHQGAPKLVLDFDGVAVVSASFADEVIGKLAEEYGPIRFLSTFPLRNMTPTIEGLLDRAIRLRVSTESPPPIQR